MRRRDFFKETAAELNRAIGLLKDLEDGAAELDELLDELPKDESKPQIASKIHKLHALLSKLKKTSKNLV